MTFTVVGMTCGHCVRAVTEEVEKLDGVRAVRVDLATGALDIEGDVDPDAVHRAVDEAGYEVRT